MIFVTVGSELPFDRLVGAVDRWAVGSTEPVFAQIGSAEVPPVNIESSQFLELCRFSEMVEKASVIVSHAGIGSILSAMQMGKPIVVMPRREHLQETRNDHQLATVNRLRNRCGVYVAETEDELWHFLDQADSLVSGVNIEPYACDELIDVVRSFINE